MKYFISFSVLLFVFQIAFSQNYQCIKDDVTYFYSNDIFFKAISIDSVVDAGDSLVYYNYPTMTDEEDINWCYSRFGPSWIGRYITVKPTGANIFYNKYFEPISIHTLKDTGEYWTCYTFDNGNYMQATMAEIQEMEFLGLTDTVKKITLQAFNPNGDSIPYPLNEKYLFLSKNYGLIRTINFKYFPNLSGGLISLENCSEYTLCGISNPAIGIQNLTRAQVYDFNIGDELHTERVLYGNGGYSNSSYFKNFVLEKEFSANLDTVIYLIYKCGYSKVVIPYEGTEYDYFEDTVTRSYFIGSDSIIDKQPDEVIIWDETSNIWQYDVTNCKYFEDSERLKKTIKGGWDSEYPHDCIFFIESKDAINKKYYIEGLGSYYYWLIPWSNSEHTTPVYYKKGNEEWGTPYTFNCNGYYTSINQESEIEDLVKIAPNPMKEWTMISIESENTSDYSLSLFNSMGIQVKEFNFFGTEYKITRDNLPDGIYFYVLDNSKGFKTSGKLILQ